MVFKWGIEHGITWGKAPNTPEFPVQDNWSTQQCNVFNATSENCKQGKQTLKVVEPFHFLAYSVIRFFDVLF